MQAKNMKITIKNEYNFMIAIFLVSFLIRLLISPIHISPPDIPHDFYAYINAGEAVIRGDLYVNLTNDKLSNEFPGPYGPLLGITYAPLLMLFGKNFFILKFPSIFFDSLNVILIYYIVKNLRGVSSARYAAILYSFSFLALLSSSVIGNNDNFELFWALLAIFLLTKNTPNITLSAISLGISISYVFVPIFILFPILYYFYQIKDIKNSLRYVFTTSLTMFAIILPFYMKAGLNVLYPYIGTRLQLQNWPPPLVGLDGMTIPHLIKMLGYYFIYGTDKPYNTYIFPGIISTISLLFGLMLFAIYLIKFKLEDKKIEFIRNTFLIFFVGLVFYAAYNYFQFIWAFPLLLILITYHPTYGNNKLELNLQELIGFTLVIVGLFVYAAIYREFIMYTPVERILLVLAIIPVTVGTYMSFSRTDIKLQLSAVTFVGYLHVIVDARPLTLLSSYIITFQSTRFSWGYYYFATIVFMIFAMFLLLKGIHTSNQKNLLQIQLKGGNEENIEKTGSRESRYPEN